MYAPPRRSTAVTNGVPELAPAGPQSTVFQAAVESSPAGMIMVDQSGTIVLLNREIERLFGYSRADLLGRSIDILVPEALRGRHPAARAEFLAHPSARPMGAGRDLFGLRKDGTQVAVEIGLNPIEMDGGRFVLASVVDITERRRTAAEQEVLLRRLVEFQEVERRDLARELHDEMGQMLTALRLMLETSALGGVEDKQVLVRQLQECVRRIATNLHPPMLETQGLLPTLAWYIARYTAQTGVRVEFAHAGLGRRFGSRLEIAAFRTVQEALTNVARHAGVAAVRVEVRADADRLTIRVEDAGPGFDAATAPQAGGGLGLLGMSERARALSGRLTVTSLPGAGTQITADLPLAQPDV
jgi:PAS domain S-box-containing protein